MRFRVVPFTLLFSLNYCTFYERPKNHESWKTKILIAVTSLLRLIPDEGEDPARTDRPLNEEDEEGQHRHRDGDGDGDGSASPSSSSVNDDGENATAPTLVPSSLNKIYTANELMSHRAKVSSRSKAGRQRSNGSSGLDNNLHLRHLQQHHLGQENNDGEDEDHEHDDDDNQER